MAKGGRWGCGGWDDLWQAKTWFTNGGHLLQGKQGRIQSTVRTRQVHAPITSAYPSTAPPPRAPFALLLVRNTQPSSHPTISSNTSKALCWSQVQHDSIFWARESVSPAPPLLFPLSLSVSPALAASLAAWLTSSRVFTCKATWHGRKSGSMAIYIPTYICREAGG